MGVEVDVLKPEASGVLQHRRAMTILFISEEVKNIPQRSLETDEMDEAPHATECHMKKQGNVKDIQHKRYARRRKMNISLLHANSHGHKTSHRHTTREDNNKKLLIIAVMMLVISCLVWGMG